MEEHEDYCQAFVDAHEACDRLKIDFRQAVAHLLRGWVMSLGLEPMPTAAHGKAADAKAKHKTLSEPAEGQPPPVPAPPAIQLPQIRKRTQHQTVDSRKASIMAFVRLSPGATVPQIAANEGITTQYAWIILSRLEQGGLVRCERSEDGRGTPHRWFTCPPAAVSAVA